MVLCHPEFQFIGGKLVKGEGSTIKTQELPKYKVT